jgi:hypothetical protein
MLLLADWLVLLLLLREVLLEVLTLVLLETEAAGLLVEELLSEILMLAVTEELEDPL